ncbi:hypothetical protein CC2G_014262 [Coprinopsis cinerea AmutBmut pab1-1]|nr:hypothetical protein CC2G_014262 [Coprinopsis cinerea AmutBmut pab1-1]
MSSTHSTSPATPRLQLVLPVFPPAPSALHRPPSSKRPPLPTEIWLSIVRYMFEAGDFVALASFATTGKPYNAMAQPFLYRDVVFRRSNNRNRKRMDIENRWMLHDGPCSARLDIKATVGGFNPSPPPNPLWLALVDIRYEILAHLNAADLKSMTEAGCGIASKELLLRFTSILVHFALDPTAFRMCMKDSGAVISGSTALAVILPRRRSFVPNDIDIYVGSTGLPVVLHYLMAKTPYTKESLLSKTRGGDIDYNGLVGGTAMLSVRLLQDPESGKTLNLIEASTVSPLPVIWGFHSTLVMNGWLIAFEEERSREVA